jgi:hypothetical protein
MTDWIKQAAKDVSKMEEESRIEHEKRVLGQQAIRREAPQIWNSLKKGLQDAIQEFNSEMPNQSLYPNPVQFSLLNSSEVEVRTVYYKGQNNTVKIQLRFDLDAQIIGCETTDTYGRMAEMSLPSVLYFKAFGDGTVALAEDENPLSIPFLVECFLKPIFLCVEFPPANN